MQAVKQEGHSTGTPPATTARSPEDAKCAALQWATGLKGTGTVYGAPAQAQSGTRTPTEAELRPPLDLPTVDAAKADLDPRCMTGRVLCVSKQTKTVAWVVDGEVNQLLDVRFGAAGTPTREGEFKVYWKSRDHHSTLYDSPMPYAMFFSGGQAVHFSEDFARNGYAGASHGCVNVRDYQGIKALFDQVDTGDKLVVHW